MMYQGSEARSLDYAERRQAERYAQQGRQVRPAFEVVEGAGLDAKVRQGVSSVFVSRLRVALVAIAVVAIVGVTRVGLYSATLGTLQANEGLRSDISTARSVENDLKVSASMLSSNSRIDRIATQNYGMVLASAAMASEQGENGEVSASTSTSTSTEAAASESAADESGMTAEGSVDGGSAENADQSGTTSALA